MWRLQLCAIPIALTLSGSCTKATDNLAKLAPLFGDDQAPFVIASIPTARQYGVSPSQSVQIFFSKEVESQRCTAAFSISQTVSGATTAPLISGSTVVVGSVLTFTPNIALSAGTYNIVESIGCEDLEGRDLRAPYNASFTVGPGGVQAVPTVVAMGVQSQSQCTTLGSVGSASGGNWLTANCWWDSTLPILGASSYTFQGGDNNTGLVGSNNACADVNTDNFVLIFNNYMNVNTTLNAVSLSRLSPPATTIRLATWSWADCAVGNASFCRALTVAFAEAEASCNGAALFGSSVAPAVGDFNLQFTAGSPAGTPRYMIQVDTTAIDSNGTKPTSTFTFTMEGK
ncbi:MAG: Ig-like domain-containing protein [Leptospirales bacterium]|nr:Ig-like domain-containing protein [Leptospirales bacterium]